MASRFKPGDGVQTPLGKGVIREVRNNSRLLVDIQQRTVIMTESAISPLDQSQRQARPMSEAAGPLPVTGRHEPHAAGEVELHGLTVEEALNKIDEALNDALLASLPAVRFIHGRTGGRIRGALHQRLREIAAVRGFRLDPHNPGVTIVKL
jgi:dsDNA-specific endonuclease/ATPase MutS2